MTTTTKSERPLFRITFPASGKDEKGNDVLSRTKEIGAVWARKNGKSGGLVSLDLIPVELASARASCSSRRWTRTTIPAGDNRSAFEKMLPACAASHFVLAPG
ncbi:MAG: hypothetical protein EOS07_07495 [Mesorhizobium sp.]|uniref:hypothetical protein n=1 Tax=Mesorhizobium sp. TaxID=1871066 RepID=UPI000FE2CBBF|nr:hypothetical protein [Mesorhizobium sp.]RWO10993.1 MAG: hypothetical protein EOS07_07495 [Mesorhizobium sp.]RWP07909.1 MAG: hypothetical protein EOQ99_04105 [Mesorhizobium sp.]RWQ22696.1 MAG: hypothetical protein EOR92_06680 [Mesorhizobium sp.]RWQ55227.1 MAG: hypothetical protein EOS84_11745 [Mesorhizobium sp.]RWQ61586.1 MAG: hypothetical protein EOS83_00465 [Mesorhizobium sp.]